MNLPTLRDLVVQQLRAEESEPSRPVEDASPPTKEGFEEHKATLSRAMKEALERRASARARLDHYRPMLEAVLRWRPGMPQGGPIWAVREAVVRLLQKEIGDAERSVGYWGHDYDRFRKRHATLTEAAYFSEMSALNRAEHERKLERYKRACDQVDAFRRHAEAVLASFEESQK